MPAHQPVAPEHCFRPIRTFPSTRSTRPDRRRAERPLSLAATFTCYYAQLCTFARRFVACPDTAEEVVSEVFLRVAQQPSAWETCVNPKSYLFAAVRNMAFKHIAHERVVRDTAALVQRQGRAPGMSEPTPAADEALEAAELADAFGDAVERLSKRCREAYWLHHEHGMSYAEISERMGTSARTVETQVLRARRVLRDSLAVWIS